MLPYYKIYNPLIKEKEGITDYSTEKLGMPFSSFKEILIYLEKNGLYKKMEFIPGASESANKFSEKLGAEVYFITARGYYLDSSDRNNVLLDSWNSLTKQKVNFVGLYHSSPKLEKIQELKINIMIEDNPKEINELSQNEIYCICVNRPYNTEIKENKFIKRCNPNQIYECVMDNYSKLLNIKSI